VFDRLSRPVHDRLGSHQSGPKQQPAPVRPSTDRSHRYRPVLPGARTLSLSKVGISCQGEEERGAAYAGGLRKNCCL
jgi:hypothetical protein